MDQIYGSAKQSPASEACMRGFAPEPHSQTARPLRTLHLRGAKRRGSEGDVRPSRLRVGGTVSDKGLQS